MSKALVVFSGGQDSTTCLGWALKNYDEVEAVSFFYGQKHETELAQGKLICESLGVKQHVVDVSVLSQLVTSALTSNGDVNEAHPDNANLPASFVPNRNATFLTLAHALGQKLHVDVLVTGVCQTDYSGYPDCRQVFITALTEALNMGSDTSIHIATPLMYLDKKQTFKLAEQVGVLDQVLALSHTCYNGDSKMNAWGRGCGACPACTIRENGYNEYKESETNV